MIKEYISAVDKAINELVLQQEFEPAELYDPIKYILSSGGKRIRAVFTLLGCQLYSSEYSSALPVAAGMEVFHNFTLLHDDIMDNAPIRRGKPTVHERWNENIALLSGDAMMILANQLVIQAPSSVLKSVFQCFNQTALEVCEGQQHDMNLEEIMLDDAMNTTGVYLNMIKLKTSVLLAACLKIGACIGGANSQEQTLLYNAGISLGLGFQLQDDLLDSFGNEKSFGKKIGGDIIARKKTFLVSKAMEMGTREQKDSLMALYNDESVAEQELIKKAKELFIETGAKFQTEELIDAYFNRSFELLDSLNVEDSASLELLKGLFTDISKRKK